MGGIVQDTKLVQIGDKSYKEVVSIVNVNTHHEHYTKTKATDMSKNDLILVNKYNYLSEDYGLINSSVKSFLPQNALVPLKIDKLVDDDVEILIKEGDVVLTAN